jgi:hypothetical protein
MKCYVICCNDSIEYVKIEDEYKARELMEEMEKNFI